MRKDFYFVVKIALLIVITGITFYIVYPKYRVINVESLIIARYNTITGRTCWAVIRVDGEWYPIENHRQRKNNELED